MNLIFVAKKPLFISSNHYLNELKRKYKEKRAGFSGILDPFACGALIVAFGHYTKLFPFLDTQKKLYKATLFLGLKSESLDLENIKGVEKIPPFSKEMVESVLKSFIGEINFTPPKYSAKKIGGKRAYELARAGEDSALKDSLREQSMQVYSLRLLNYSHPFISFSVCVSKGGYVRSLGELISSKLGCVGALSYLERISEGELVYNKEKPLNPLEILPFEKIDARGDKGLREIILNGKRWNPKLKESKKYIVQFSDFFSIITQSKERVEYLANRIPLC
ncbi:MAG: tRNA pseudouridine(55) synthase TruB [Helicobacter sp.]|nr:tRNA pseudouridine(55) synthase TruB [Helicobacter sp.]